MSVIKNLDVHLMIVVRKNDTTLLFKDDFIRSQSWKSATSRLEAQANLLSSGVHQIKKRIIGGTRFFVSKCTFFVRTGLSCSCERKIGIT